MLTMESFVSDIEKRVKVALEEGNSDVSVRIHKVPKNNDVIKTGIVCEKKGSCLSPVIYLDDFYSELEAALPINANETIVENELRKIADRIINLLSESIFPEKIDTELYQHMMNDLEDKVCMRLVNHDMNRNNLENMIHIDFFDLAITFFYLLKMDKEGVYSIKITNDFKDIDPDLDEHKLLLWAVENTLRYFPIDFRSMSEVLKKLYRNMPGECKNHMKMDQEFDAKAEDVKNNLFVLSNVQGSDGATVILYPGLLKEIADKLDDDLIIIPCSINMVLICRKSSSFGNSEMVKLVNGLSDKESVLSDHLYLYQREIDNIVMMEDEHES